MSSDSSNPPLPPPEASSSSSSSSSPPPSSSTAPQQQQAEPIRMPSILKNDPARTGFDPKTAWWINYFNIVLGKVTPEGQFHYREWRTRENEAKDCARCEKWRDFLLQNSPTVVFMRDKVAALNGQLDRDNIMCRRCPARVTKDGEVYRQSGGFHPRFGILICANEIRSRGHLEDTLAHEMVHAWDHLRWKVDWKGPNLKHAACTEIRAAMLSGECRWTRETFTRGNRGLTQQFQNCVRARAARSVMARPNCKDDVHAVKVVNEVWDSCFSDTRPFDEVYSGYQLSLCKMRFKKLQP